MAKKITIDGRELPVSAKFWREVVAPLRERSFRMAEIRNDVSRLERESERRQLDDNEEARKGRLVKIWNVGNATALLKGRPLSDFGFEHADQVHHRLWHPHCGCVVREVFDHHLAGAYLPHEHHAHFPDRVCGRHRALAVDFHAHREGVRADHDLRQEEIEAETAKRNDE